MALELLHNHLTEQEYLQERSNQGPNTLACTKTPLTNFKLFCEDTMNASVEKVLDELRHISDHNEQVNKTLMVMQKFINWLAVPHPEIEMPRKNGHSIKRCMAKDPDSIKSYTSQIRLYMRKVGGIKVTAEDVSDFINYPSPIEKDEVEPLLAKELKKICQHSTEKRSLLYRITKDTCSRIGAMVQLRKKHFNTEVRPIEVTFPKHIMKKKNGKSFTNVKYVTQEDERDLLEHLEKISNPESLVFGTNEDPILAVSTEEKTWRRLVNKIGLNEKYSHNGRLKKNIHSIKAFTFTAAEEAVNETFANAYGDHSIYIKNYLRWSDEKKIVKFKMLEPLLSLYTPYERVTDGDLIKENNILNAKLSEHDKILESIVSKTKDKTKQNPDTETREMMLQLLKENKLI